MHIILSGEHNQSLAVCDFFLSKEINIQDIHFFRDIEGAFFHLLFPFRCHISAVRPDKIVSKIQVEDIINLIADRIASQLPCRAGQMVYSCFQPIAEHCITHLWDGKHHLEECLDSLSKQTFKAFETILVDNGSEDGSIEFVEKNFPAVKIIKLNKNEGFCRGNNIGLQHSSGDFIALLNNDTLVDMHWLEELFKAMTKHSHVGICASCIVNYYFRDILDTAGDGFDLCGVGYKVGEGMPVTEL